MRNVVKMPEREPPLRCESGDPTCGPVTQFDDWDVPLCQRCWDSLGTETAAQRRAREMGIEILPAPPKENAADGRG